MRSRINILIQLQIFNRVKADTIIPEMNDTLLFPYNGANVKEMRPVVFRETISDDIHSHLLDAETYHHTQFPAPNPTVYGIFASVQMAENAATAYVPAIPEGSG